jgi:hypothetical protein
MLPAAGKGSLCAYLRCINNAGRAAGYSTELAGHAAAEAGVAGRRPEDMVFYTKFETYQDFGHPY